MIDDEYVLTAEHCWRQIRQMDPEKTGTTLSTGFFLTFSDWRNDDQSGDETYTEFELVPEKIFFRPDRPLGMSSSNDKLENSADLAILKIPSLKKTLKKYPAAKVQAACLPEKPVLAGSHCWVAGWGLTEDMQKDMTMQEMYAEFTPKVLQTGPINTMSFEYCKDHRDPTILLHVLENER